MTDQTFRATGLDALFAPGSIALVGVSDRDGSYGKALDEMCHAGGFGGRILRVNPRLTNGQGREVFADLAGLPLRPDHVVLSLATARVEPAVEEALAAGARALTIFSECPDERMRRRIGDRVRAAGAVLCGPNSMGFHNITEGLRITPFPVPQDLKPGGIGLIAQSGSILGALMNNDRRLRFSQAISTGSETVTTAADYLKWMVHRPETRVVGMFLETVRDPEGFIAAMEAASRRDIPVVILKVGRSALGARMAISHTGALVGNDDLFRALVRRLGGHLADTVDELAAMLTLFSQGRRASAPGIASIHDSGGERELMADLAEDHGLHYASLSEATLAQVQSVLEPGIVADNPLDAWGTGHEAQKTYAQSMAAMMQDDAVGSGLYVLNWRQNYGLHEMHEKALVAAFGQTEKPLVAVSNFSGSSDAPIADRLANHGIPLISGMQNALRAIQALNRHGPVSGFRANLPEHPKAAEWRKTLSGCGWVGEAEGYALFADFGISCPQHGLARSREEALRIAAGIDGAVILKTAQSGLSHKSDMGGVKPGLASPEAIAEAYDDLASRFCAKVLVAKMLEPGSEWCLGAINDPDFGPAVRISPGGLLIELTGEHCLLPAPFSSAEARTAILQLAASRLLTGYRGAPPLAVEALAETAAALSHLSWALRDILAEVEINPVIVGKHSAVAADAVVSLRAI